MIKPRISLCLTNFNRTDLLLKSFAKVLNDERISEIVIVDDCSTEENWKKAVDMVSIYTGSAETTPDKNGFVDTKIKFIRNEQNIGMSRNKAEAIRNATNDFVIIFDSDNVMETAYLNALYSVKWNPDTILIPSFARPQFNYRVYNDKLIRRGNIKPLIKNQHMYGNMFDCLMNTCNYFVHRKTYLEVYQYNPEIKGTDTLWFNYLWLKSGKSFLVVPDMEYEHRVHNESGWLKDADYNSKKGDEIKRLIMAL